MVQSANISGNHGIILHKKYTKNKKKKNSYLPYLFFYMLSWTHIFVFFFFFFFFLFWFFFILFFIILYFDIIPI